MTTTNPQWTRSGWDRENAILQGLLAQGYSLDQARQIAAEQAEPMTADEAMGRVLIWVFKWLIVAPLVLIALVGVYVWHGNAGYEKCFAAHRGDTFAVEYAACGDAPAGH